jgi:hypothetical protein
MKSSPLWLEHCLALVLQYVHEVHLRSVVFTGGPQFGNWQLDQVIKQFFGDVIVV